MLKGYSFLINIGLSWVLLIFFKIIYIVDWIKLFFDILFFVFVVMFYVLIDKSLDLSKIFVRFVKICEFWWVNIRIK